MLGALDYTVMELQRIEFMGIQLQDKDALLRGPGDWKTLNQREMTIVEAALKIALPL
jgi:16S rRNA U516 pseudouridylate synthase RsuA-like enzyme